MENTIHGITKAQAHKAIARIIESQGYDFDKAFDIFESPENPGCVDCAFNFVNHSDRLEGAVMTLWINNTGNLVGEW